MDDKVMLNDYLAGLNADLATLGSAIAQTEDETLYNKLKALRDADEVRQREVYKIAKSKGYYIPAEPATEEQISTVKSQVTTG
ncbi:Coat F domain-containing protein [Hathewaya proteolytica DSM 3090]|uniref:Coat F domain-containing protein n=1 Tax=Hathewaya proteolytica DSM 3090 TaxID=1121331 RepID=A0A1M6J3J7_9CLOT|nr:spore coat protein [Hathewaya proteolytica]SHJ41259.1 Coat F domain-containing protein [Hathewaya proteolytica DSM 3090]